MKITIKILRHISEALDMILSPESPDDDDLEDEKYIH